MCVCVWLVKYENDVVNKFVIQIAVMLFVVHIVIVVFVLISIYAELSLMYDCISYMYVLLTVLALTCRLLLVDVVVVVLTISSSFTPARFRNVIV